MTIMLAYSGSLLYASENASALENAFRRLEEV